MVFLATRENHDPNVRVTVTSLRPERASASGLWLGKRSLFRYSAASVVNATLLYVAVAFTLTGILTVAHNLFMNAQKDNKPRSFTSTGRHDGMQPGKQGFTLVELIAALCVLTLLASCFYVSLDGVHRLQAAVETERNAIVVLGNLVERLEHERIKDYPKVKLIFEDEFRKSSLAGKDKVTPYCQAGDGVIIVRLVTEDGKILAGLELKE